MSAAPADVLQKHNASPGELLSPVGRALALPLGSFPPGPRNPAALDAAAAVAGRDGISSPRLLAAQQLNSRLSAWTPEQAGPGAVPTNGGPPALALKSPTVGPVDALGATRANRGLSRDLTNSAKSRRVLDKGDEEPRSSLQTFLVGQETLHGAGGVSKDLEDRCVYAQNSARLGRRPPGEGGGAQNSTRPRKHTARRSCTCDSSLH